MNAYEILKNIILDGINQSRESIWERLLIPNFEIPQPQIGEFQSNFLEFNSQDELYDFELRKLIRKNISFEKIFYANKPELREREFYKFYMEDFSEAFRAIAPVYYNYKKERDLCVTKLNEIQKIEKEIKNLLCNDEFKTEVLMSKNMPETIKQILGTTALERVKNCLRLREGWQSEGGKEIVLNRIQQHLIEKLNDKLFIRHYFSFREEVKRLESQRTKNWGQYIDRRKQFIEERKQHYENQNEELQIWNDKKKEHLMLQKKRNEEIKFLKSNYLRANPDSIKELCRKILELSKYNFEFEKKIEIDFVPNTRILLVEYTLPNIEQLPRIKETKYFTSKKEFKNVEISQGELLKLFDETVYSITLRSIYEILINDTNKAIDAVSFNGWIKSVNKATGKKENTCIISIQVKRAEFLEIELQNVEPKSCFKFFKGVGSSKLYGITAIQPILQIQKDDKRFVNSQNIEFDNSTNLALMDWEDFEHLIRELFEKEFTSNGGEVKVTQASRDGGVDAVAFDPHPIRGGKIVIQAKRYTNTVGVSAVRDLYGTVLNEGANKGILVTTSDYGPDSYEFAKGKPLTLLNGANLLYLLERHGTRAKIDIKEAKRIQEENR